MHSPLSILDRAAAKRRDAAWLAEQIKHPDARFLPCWRSKSLIVSADQPRPAVLSAAELGRDLLSAAPLVFLGLINQQSRFALVLPDADETIPERLSSFGVFHNLRRLLPRVREEDYVLLAQARAIIFWQQQNRYCGACGSSTTISEGGYLLTCSNQACGRQHFPRTDPAVIMRICQGERCLLARQASWPQGLFSVLAGFVEPGETLEDAVRREVMEEAGVRIRSVKYFASQPWPFPASLMLGFTAEFESGEIYCADNELDEVRWFSREEVRQGIKQGSLKLPIKGTLSRRLISDWLDEE